MARDRPPHPFEPLHRSTPSRAMAAKHHNQKVAMTTTQQPPTTDEPLFRKLIAKLPRRVAIALVIALAGLMAAALVVPPLAAVLVVVLPACALLILGYSAVHWFKHRPMAAREHGRRDDARVPRRYDDKGKLQPNRIENLLLVMFSYTPLLFWAALTDSDGLDFWFWIAGALIAPLYFLGKLALFRWWLPRKERTATSTHPTS